MRSIFDFINEANKTSIDIDFSKYDKFMKEFISKDVKYFKSFTRDDVLHWYTTTEDGEVLISLQLQVEKGYGSSSNRSERYRFVYTGHEYETDRPLRDNDKEAQIVRKFVYGLETFLKFNAKKMPKTLNVKIFQDFD